MFKKLIYFIMVLKIMPTIIKTNHFYLFIGFVIFLCN